MSSSEANMHIPEKSVAPPGYWDQDGTKADQTMQHSAQRFNFEGLPYTIKHRTTNTTLELQLREAETIKSVPAAMVHMSATAGMSGKISVTFKKLFTGNQMDEVTYTGPGNVTLAPTLMGDVMPLPIDGPWFGSKHCLLAWTPGVVRDTTTQGFSKAIFSGTGIFIYTFKGHGLLWLKAFGAIEELELAAGQEHIVNTGHLVAWNCPGYTIERASNSWRESVKTGEGLVCRFRGPGRVLLQSRNIENFESFIAAHSSS